MVEKNSFKEILRQKLINLAKKTIFTAKDMTSFTRRYKFEDRSKNSDTLCIILAGYKENLWDIVFDRIDKFSDEKMDICIVSSGLYSEKLSQIAKEKNWSYVSTKQNSVGLIQNMALKLFPEAKWIYKLDEDIFVTENFFKVLKDTYDKVQDNGDYNVGFVAPVIPINSFGYYLLLKKLNLEDYFEENFEKIKVGAMGNMIELDGEVAKFMWGKDNYIPHIDDLNKEFNNLPFSYSASTVRVNIGAILYHRSLWEAMHYFRVDITIGMGVDEEQICAYCINRHLGMIIAENSCVGHFSFSKQTDAMNDFFYENPNRFLIKE